MTAAVQSVPYSRLESGQIRLISIHQGIYSDPLQCDLHVVSLDDHECHYKALSYVWGDPNVTTTIQLCGVPHQATINLQSALRHIRSSKHDVLLWADAVCINQTDLIERGNQVAQMGRIYASAEQVLAWLGEATEDSDLAIDGIQLFTSNPNLHWTPRVKGSAAVRKAGYSSADKYLAAFLDISTRPWWKRVWIIQEALLARDLVFLCGGKTVPATLVKRFLELWAKHTDEGACCQTLRPPENWAASNVEVGAILEFRELITMEINGVPPLNLHSRDPEERSRRLALIRALDWQGEGGQDPEHDRYFLLLDQIINYRQRLCTDPRDKVYALLPMVSALKSVFIPNYSISCDQVYANFAFRVIREQKNLDILTILIPGQSDVSIPTWAPDWRYRVTVDGQLIRPYLDDTTLYKRFDDLCHFNAASSMPCVVDLVSELVLSVEGCICGEVEFVGKYRLGWPYGSRNSLQWFNRFVDIYNTNIGPERDHVSMNTVIDAILAYPRTTMGKRLWYSKFYLMYHRFCSDRSDNFLRRVQLLRRKLVPQSWWENGWQTADVFNDAVWMRRYMIAQNDLIGFVPHNTQPGDKICILFGGRVPYVIREVPGEVEVGGKKHPKHIILGDCYVHHLMQGEGVQMMERGETTRQRFFLN